MHVAYALPGLHRATVMVPKHRWQAGGHVQVGEALAAGLAELKLQARRDGGSLRES